MAKASAIRGAGDPLSLAEQQAKDGELGFWGGLGQAGAALWDNTLGGTAAWGRFDRTLNRELSVEAFTYKTIDIMTGEEMDVTDYVGLYAMRGLYGLQFVGDVAITEPFLFGNSVLEVTGAVLPSLGESMYATSPYGGVMPGLPGMAVPRAEGPSGANFSEYLAESRMLRDPGSWGITDPAQLEQVKAAPIAAYGYAGDSLMETGTFDPNASYRRYMNEVVTREQRIANLEQAAAIMFTASTLRNPLDSQMLRNPTPRWPTVGTNVSAFVALQEGVTQMEALAKGVELEIEARRLRESTSAYDMEDQLSLSNQIIAGFALDPLEGVGWATDALRLGKTARIADNARSAVAAAGVPPTAFMGGSFVPSPPGAVAGINPFQATRGSLAAKAADPYDRIGTQLATAFDDRSTLRSVLEQFYADPVAALRDGIDLSGVASGPDVRLLDSQGFYHFDPGVWLGKEMQGPGAAGTFAIGATPSLNISALRGVGPVDSVAFRKEWSANWLDAASEYYGAGNSGNPLASALGFFFGDVGRGAGEFLAGLNAGQRRVMVETMISSNPGTWIANSTNANFTAAVDNALNIRRADDVEASVLTRGYDRRLTETFPESTGGPNPTPGWSEIRDGNITKDNLSIFDVAQEALWQTFSGGSYVNAVNSGMGMKRNIAGTLTNYANTIWTGNTTWFGMKHVGFGEKSNYARVFDASQDAYIQGNAAAAFRSQRQAYIDVGMAPAEVDRMIDELTSVVTRTPTAADPGTPGREALAKVFDEYEAAAEMAGPNPLLQTGMRDVFAQSTLPSYDNLMAGSVKTGTDTGRFTMLDPSANRMNMDDWLNQWGGFPYFVTHSLLNWGERIAAKPSILGDAARVERAVVEQNERDGVGLADKGTIAGSIGEWDFRFRNPLWRLFMPFGGLLNFSSENISEAETVQSKIGFGLQAVGFTPMWAQSMLVGMTDDIKYDQVWPMLGAAHYGVMSLAGTEVSVPQIDFEQLAKGNFSSAISSWNQVTIPGNLSSRFGSDYSAYNFGGYVKEMVQAGLMTAEEGRWVNDLQYARMNGLPDLVGMPANIEGLYYDAIGGFGRERGMSQATSSLLGVRVRPVPVGEVELREAEIYRQQILGLVEDFDMGEPTLVNKNQLWDAYNYHVDENPGLNKPLRESVYSLLPPDKPRSITDTEYGRPGASLVSPELRDPMGNLITDDVPARLRPPLTALHPSAVSNHDPDAIMNYGSPFYLMTLGPEVHGPTRASLQPPSFEVAEPVYKGEPFAVFIKGFGDASEQAVYAAGVTSWEQAAAMTLEGFESIQGLSDSKAKMIWEATRPPRADTFYSDLMTQGDALYGKYLGKVETDQVADAADAAAIAKGEEPPSKYRNLGYVAPTVDPTGVPIDRAWQSPITGLWFDGGIKEGGFKAEPINADAPVAKQFADAIEDVGAAKAEGIAGLYGSWTALAGASPKQLAEVKGISEAGGEKIIAQAAAVVGQGGYERYMVNQQKAEWNADDGLSTLYTLVDPRTDEIRYVGKTIRTAQERYGEHLGQMADDDTNSKKGRWEADLYQKGLYPEQRLLDMVPDDELGDWELIWIGYLRFRSGVDSDIINVEFKGVETHDAWFALLQENGVTVGELDAVWGGINTKHQLIEPPDAFVRASDVTSGRPHFSLIPGISKEAVATLGGANFGSWSEIIAGEREDAIERLDDIEGPGVGPGTAEKVYEYALEQAAIGDFIESVSMPTPTPIPFAFMAPSVYDPYYELKETLWQGEDGGFGPAERPEWWANFQNSLKGYPSFDPYADGALTTGLPSARLTGPVYGPPTRPTPFNPSNDIFSLPAFADYSPTQGPPTRSGVYPVGHPATFTEGGVTPGATAAGGMRSPFAGAGARGRRSGGESGASALWPVHPGAAGAQATPVGGYGRNPYGPAEYYYDVVTGAPRKAGADFQVLQMTRNDKVVVSYPEDGRVLYNGVDYGGHPYSAGSIAVASVMAGGDMGQPFAGDFDLTQGFGVNPERYKSWGGHMGLDWAMPVGTPLLATIEGTVLATGYSPAGGKAAYPGTGGFGNFVLLRGADGSLQTEYGHLSQIDVEPGQEVKAGAQLGLSGHTGVSDFPHLHFGVRSDGEYVDPSGYLAGAPPVGAAAEAGAATTGRPTGGTAAQLDAIKGVGPAMMAAFAAAGVTTLGEARQLSAAQLDAIEGVGPTMIDRILGAGASSELGTAPATKRQGVMAMAAGTATTTTATGETPDGYYNFEDLPEIGPAMEADLYAAGITTLDQLAAMSMAELDKIPRVGEVTAKKIMAAATEALKAIPPYQNDTVDAVPSAPMGVVGFQGGAARIGGVDPAPGFGASPFQLRPGMPTQSPVMRSRRLASVMDESQPPAPSLDFQMSRWRYQSAVAARDEDSPQYGYRDAEGKIVWPQFDNRPDYPMSYVGFAEADERADIDRMQSQRVAAGWQTVLPLPNRNQVWDEQRAVALENAGVRPEAVAYVDRFTTVQGDDLAGLAGGYWMDDRGEMAVHQLEAYKEEYPLASSTLVHESAHAWYSAKMAGGGRDFFAGFTDAMYAFAKSDPAIAQRAGYEGLHAQVTQFFNEASGPYGTPAKEGDPWGRFMGLDSTVAGGPYSSSDGNVLDRYYRWNETEMFAYAAEYAGGRATYMGEGSGSGLGVLPPALRPYFAGFLVPGQEPSQMFSPTNGRRLDLGGDRSVGRAPGKPRWHEPDMYEDEVSDIASMWFERKPGKFKAAFAEAAQTAWDNDVDDDDDATSLPDNLANAIGEGAAEEDPMWLFQIAAVTGAQDSRALPEVLAPFFKPLFVPGGALGPPAREGQDMILDDGSGNRGRTGAPNNYYNAGSALGATAAPAASAPAEFTIPRGTKRSKEQSEDRLSEYEMQRIEDDLIEGLLEMLGGNR